MWARVSELWLGAWLLISPLVFRGTEAAQAFATRDLIVGSLVALLSLLSFWRRTVHAHLLTAVVALGLGLAAYLGGPRPGPPAAQNEITVAMLLVLLAIVPNEASRPPRGWRGTGGVRV